MKKWMAGASALALLLAGAARAEDVTLQLKWVTQAQFAGYYVAQDKGFYEEEGLDVTIKPGGPDVAPAQVIAGGGADVVIDWMPSALAAREKGLPLVNIAQPFKSSGMDARPAATTSGVTSTDKFKGQTLGRLVRRERVSVPVLDVEARHPDRRRAGRGDGAEAGVQRRSPAAEAGGLHLDDDLQRVLAGDRRRAEAGGADRLQVRGRGGGDAGGRALRAGGEARRSGVRRHDGEVRPRLDEGVEVGGGEPRRRGDDRARQRRDRARRPRSTRSG